MKQRPPVPRYDVRPRALSRWRHRMGWRQSDAAQAFGVSLRYYQHLEHGTRDMPPWVGLAAAALLHDLPAIGEASWSGPDHNVINCNH